MQMKLKFYILFCFITIFTINFIETTKTTKITKSSTGINPPQLPEEYFCNIIQRKWNHNGFGVNHTSSATSYSSYSQQYYRFDTASIETPGSTNNQTSSSTMSLNDYTGKVIPTPLNTFVELHNVGQVPTCANYNSTWPPPLPSNALSLLHAIYSGERIIPYFGKVSEWTVIEKTATATFWFSIETDDIVGYQFESLDPQQGEVGVVTYMFNLFTGEVPTSVFEGAGGFQGCVNEFQSSIQREIRDRDLAIHPKGVIPLHGFHTWLNIIRSPL